ncbi:nuclear transport factor 2 family protein [uncultured Psychroserpens sp.]|uniref:nuclear transport factor 2 family protein n=1 Tax=uncultured Psychroserpens sp. TaxID=255436 RepID=UPI0026027B40|nr:nuclear transport factor 2 family protein [uncultured Psychroserpens sp.]
MRTVKDVWEHHKVAFANANLEEVMLDYAEDCIYVTTNKSLVGKDKIRALYKNHFDTLEEGSSSSIISETIEGEIVFFEWTADSPSISISDGVDTFVIRNGYIVAQTMRATVVPK